MLMSFLGAILPAWGYHLRDNHIEVGWYFLALGAGLVVSYPGSRKLLSHRDLRFAVTAGCSIASAGFVLLALAAPPVAFEWRVVGITLLGLSAGVLNAAGFQAISRIYEHDPASTVNMAGAMFGLGCLTTALAVWGAFYIYGAASLVLLFAISSSARATSINMSKAICIDVKWGGV